MKKSLVLLLLITVFVSTTTVLAVGQETYLDNHTIVNSSLINADSIEALTLKLSNEPGIDGVQSLDGQIFYILNGTSLMCYDYASNSTTSVFESTTEIAYYCPDGNGGAMIGSQKPTVIETDELSVQSGITPLSWDGEYYYVDFASGELTPVSDPALFALVATSTYSNVSSYTTTINGKAIPSSTYPYGSNYSGSDNGGTECHGFGHWVMKYLYSTYSATQVSVNSSGIQTILSTYSPGTFIRATTKNGGNHTMIYVGNDSNGIYVYHANWDTDPDKNIVYITYFTWSEFDSTFPTIQYIRKHDHSYGAWIYYTSALHKSTCSVCGYYKTEPHTFASNGECSVCLSEYFFVLE